MKKNKTEKTNNTTEMAIADVISNLCIPILQQHTSKIVGIYLSPFSIGEKQKIQIVVTKSNDSKLNIQPQPTTINQLQIFVSEGNIQEYKTNPKTDIEYQLAKDLKTGIILYDVHSKLAIKKEILDKNSEIVPFYNTFELSDSLKTMIKTKIRNYKKNSKN